MLFRKLFLFLPLFSLALLFPQLSRAQNVQEAKDYALLISQPRHVKGVLMMLKKMRTDKSMLPYRNARVVLYGEAIHTAKKGTELAPLIGEAVKENVSIAICNQAMQRLKVTKKDLLDSAEVVDNAIYEMLRLKTNGYISIDL